MSDQKQDKSIWEKIWGSISRTIKINLKPSLILLLYLFLVLYLEPNDSYHFFVLPLILVLWMYNKFFEEENPDEFGIFTNHGGFVGKTSGPNTGPEGAVPEAERYGR